MSLTTPSPLNRLPLAGAHDGGWVGMAATCLFSVGFNASRCPVASMR
ncbi:MAG: hypothetical protein LCI02_20210 [Proteobacteria bacterium]|nr:hypothetical protein [Pseudomonadota bacterium]